uniref:Uncharacterized protein n=1 Tax=Pseudomonas aeruginosa TaxID=287 RepID=O68802_PSEAI|nr:unknown [Pseudomonas aeruginosa PAO1]
MNFFSSPGFPGRKSKDPVARSSRRGLQENLLRDGIRVP